MANPLIRMAVMVWGCALLVASAQGEEFDNAQTAGQISNKRNQACKGLKGSALEQCLNSYVGPEQGNKYGRDSVYTGKHGGSSSRPFKGRGEWTKPGRS